MAQVLIEEIGSSSKTVSILHGIWYSGFLCDQAPLSTELGC